MLLLLLFDYVIVVKNEEKNGTGRCCDWVPHFFLFIKNDQITNETKIKSGHELSRISL